MIGVITIQTIGYAPADPNEWLLFIEAYALMKDFKTAENLSELMLADDNDARVNRGLCVVWKRIQANGLAGSEKKVQEMLAQFNCNS